MADQRLGPPEIIAVASLVAFFVATLLPWFTVSVTDPSGVLEPLSFPDLNGWDTGLLWSLFPLLLGTALVGALLLPIAAPGGTDPLPVAVPLVLGALAVTVLAARLGLGVTPAGAENAEAIGGSVEVQRALGLFLAFLATVGMLVAGVLAFRRDGGSPPAHGTVPPAPA